MKLRLLVLIMLGTQYSFGQSFQLAPPLLSYKSSFFTGSTTFEVMFNQPGAKVYYTTNGTAPTEKDKVYSKPVTIKKKTKVNAIAIGDDFQPSEMVSAMFIPGGKTIQQVSFSKPDESYANAGADILRDHIGGIANYRHGTWLGYNTDTATFEIVLTKQETVKEVLISMLKDENSWIFLPQQLNIYAFDESKQRYDFIAGESFKHTEPGHKRVDMHSVNLMKKVKTGRLKIVAIPLAKIPDWHAGKGNHGWFFVDEIKVF